MYFPKLTAPAQRRVTVDRFLGLDRRAGSAMGCFQNMENLWSGGYPALETRPARGEAAVLSKPNGLTCRDALVWVDGTALYVGGEKTGLALSDGEKQLVNMGAYLLIWPDRKYINTQDLSDFGSMENRNVTAGEVTTALCRSGGEELGDYAAGAAAPDAPEAGTLWLDTSDAEPVMKRYDGSAWLDVENVCTKISAAGIGRGFAAGDGVTVEGCEAQTLNGLHVLDAAGDDWIAVPAATATVGSQTAEVTAARRVPDMDFVVEQGNRLWGCKYGIVDGRPVNEIYASKLGDFRNWNSFAGLSTDSYAASRGSDGAFTGAAACLGGVIFFKEDCMERVYPSATGAHQIVTLRCPGVKKGCHGAAAVVDGTLFYLGLGGVYAFDGSMPGCVSMPLGSVRYQDGAAAGWNGQKVDDLLTWIMLGVVAGGRIGYVLFYDLPSYLAQPSEIFKIWNGGMSFHGGLLGVLLAGLWWSRREKKRFLDVVDFVAPLVPPGLFFGRLGNFINGELWGGVTDGPLGMVFPTGGPLPRHPSQLYEAGLEGVAMFVILWAFSSRIRPTGRVSGLFAVLYGVFRFAVEFVRQPDPQLGYLAFGWLTMGQLLCVPLLAAGFWLLFRPVK